MVDYTKIYLLNIDVERLLVNENLDFTCALSKSSGLVNENVLVAEYHFCKITVINSRSQKPHVLFSGSIHKLWNDLNGINSPNYNVNKIYKGFNGNQFALDNILDVREHLENLFDCNPSQMIFQNIEFGINTEVNFNPIMYLKGLLYHKNKLFEFSHSGNNTAAHHSNFVFKIYNKTYQYKMAENILRVELKIIKMIAIEKLGIKTFLDINEFTLNNVRLMLLKRFDEVMHYDYSIDKNKLSRREVLATRNYSNPRYWIEDLKPIHRDRHKKKLGDITLHYSNNLHSQIKSEIQKKCVMINLGLQLA